MTVKFFKEPYVLFANNANAKFYKLIGFARDTSTPPGNYVFMNPVVILC